LVLAIVVALTVVTSRGASTFAQTATPQDTVFTVILAGGKVYDGTGADPIVADVGILKDHIAAIGDLHGKRAGLRLNVRGLAVVPGFIDIHSHAARSQPERSGIFRHPLAENYLRQGVTTAIGGPDGSSPYPIGEYLARLEALPAAINFGTFVGHGTIRRRVLGNENRAPTPLELEQMKAMVDSAMREGAFGLSSGLKYVPGAYASTEEVIELARVAARYGGIYISHMREEGLKLLDSVAETIRIGEEAGLPAQITHHKVVGARMWGKSTETLRMVDEARARGVDVTIDQYPYTASSTGLTILFPAWSLEGDSAALAARLQDPQARARIKEAIIFNLVEDRGGNDPANVVIARCRWDPSLDGKSLADILKERGFPVTMDAAAELAIELQEKGGFQGIFHAMSEEDVQRIMQYPFTMIASDGGIVAPGAGVPHPRNYGTFARVLGRYVRERKVLSFSEAIRKMTSLPASRIGLKDRGVLKVGAIADVAVLDPKTIIDRATFSDPHQYAAGVRHVFVAGKAVLLNGEVTGARPGRVLRSTDR
jgi:dihydroorotase/N-acyl-D-amino-acid deacylase